MDESTDPESNPEGAGRGEDLSSREAGLKAGTEMLLKAADRFMESGFYTAKYGEFLMNFAKDNMLDLPPAVVSEIMQRGALLTQEQSQPSPEREA